MAKNYKLDIAYDGTLYHGWQEQKTNEKTIQAVVQTAIYAATGQRTVVNASGRTDAGVHALCQVANVHMDTKIPYEKLPYAINAYLPEDIRIRNCALAEEGFDARFDAKKKTYMYNIYNSRISSPFYQRYSLQVGVPLDMRKMQENASMLIGEHDFTSFYKKVQGVKKSPIRTIYSSDFAIDGDLLKYEITGNGFLYNMVRIIVGTLIKIGLGKEQSNVLQIMEKKDRLYSGPTAKAQGLFLKKVMY